MIYFEDENFRQLEHDHWRQTSCDLRKVFANERHRVVVEIGNCFPYHYIQPIIAINSFVNFNEQSERNVQRRRQMVDCASLQDIEDTYIGLYIGLW